MAVGIGKIGKQKGFDIIGRHEQSRGMRAAEIAPDTLRKDRDELSGAAADAVDLSKSADIGIEDTADRAEAVEEDMGSLVGIGT